MSDEKCGFLIYWVGYCDKDKPCPTHGDKKCAVCGDPATQECGETLGAFVCGRLLCDEHGPGNSCIDRHTGSTPWMD